jgi:hypothetical protein
MPIDGAAWPPVGVGGMSGPFRRRSCRHERNRSRQVGHLVAGPGRPIERAGPAVQPASLHAGGDEATSRRPPRNETRGSTGHFVTLAGSRSSTRRRSRRPLIASGSMPASGSSRRSASATLYQHRLADSHFPSAFPAVSILDSHVSHEVQRAIRAGHQCTWSAGRADTARTMMTSPHSRSVEVRGAENLSPPRWALEAGSDRPLGLGHRVRTGSSRRTGARGRRRTAGRTEAFGARRTSLGVSGGPASLTAAGSRS